MATLELFSGDMFFKTARSLILTISILFTTNFDHILRITFLREVNIELSMS